ncbi:hypothetical protein C8Q77DRAFT_1120690 [Trametes polyzona]|nr:hypothetical protein C8Q77DRAFT_1120690 [Trametes polyzona]
MRFDVAVYFSLVLLRVLIGESLERASTAPCSSLLAQRYFSRRGSRMTRARRVMTGRKRFYCELGATWSYWPGLSAVACAHLR